MPLNQGRKWLHYTDIDQPIASKNAIDIFRLFVALIKIPILQNVENKLAAREMENKVSELESAFRVLSERCKSAEEKRDYFKKEAEWAKRQNSKLTGKQISTLAACILRTHYLLNIFK